YVYEFAVVVVASSLTVVVTALYMIHLPSWANQKLANIEKIIESSAGEMSSAADAALAGLSSLPPGGPDPASSVLRAHGLGSLVVAEQEDADGNSRNLLLRTRFTSPSYGFAPAMTPVEIQREVEALCKAAPGGERRRRFSFGGEGAGGEGEAGGLLVEGRNSSMREGAGGEGEAGGLLVEGRNSSMRSGGLSHRSTARSSLLSVAEGGGVAVFDVWGGGARYDREAGRFGVLWMSDDEEEEEEEGRGGVFGGGTGSEDDEILHIFGIGSADAP
ncbi:hypothetical protein TeGR_g7302, partial [Tetraparma gracilis]